MASILPFPPRRASHYPAFVEFATPDDIRRKTPDEAPDLYEALARSSYRLTLRDRLEMIDWSAFAAGFVAGAVAWSLLVITPFAVGWL